MQQYHCHRLINANAVLNYVAIYAPGFAAELKPVMKMKILSVNYKDEDQERNSRRVTLKIRICYFYFFAYISNFVNVSCLIYFNRMVNVECSHDFLFFIIALTESK